MQNTQIVCRNHGRHHFFGQVQKRIRIVEQKVVDRDVLEWLRVQSSDQQIQTEFGEKWGVRQVRGYSLKTIGQISFRILDRPSD